MRHASPRGVVPSTFTPASGTGASSPISRRTTLASPGASTRRNDTSPSSSASQVASARFAAATKSSARAGRNSSWSSRAISGSRTWTARGNASAGQRQNTSHSSALPAGAARQTALLLAPLDRLALVEALLPPGEGELDLGAPPPEVERERHEGPPPLRH